MEKEKSVFRKVFEAVLGFYAALAVLAGTILLFTWLFALFK